MKGCVEVFPDDPHEGACFHDVFGFDAFETGLIIGKDEDVFLLVFDIVNGRAGVKRWGDDKCTVQLAGSRIETDGRESNVDTVDVELIKLLWGVDIETFGKGGDYE